MFGIAFLAAPEPAIRGWIGARAARGQAAQMLTRAVGARDLGVGLGALRALAAGDRTAAAWLGAGALADAGDFAATLAADLPPAARAGALAIAGTSAVAGIACAARVGRGADVTSNGVKVR